MKGSDRVGGYSGTKPAAEMRPPAQLPSGAVSTRDRPAMTITEFLLARLADDEAAMAFEDCDCPPNDETRPGCASRLLTDIAAKRRIVADCVHWIDSYDDVLAGNVLGYMAWVYRWHPEWQETWKPWGVGL